MNCVAATGGGFPAARGDVRCNWGFGQVQGETRHVRRAQYVPGPQETPFYPGERAERGPLYAQCVQIPPPAFRPPLSWVSSSPHRLHVSSHQINVRRPQQCILQSLPQRRQPAAPLTRYLNPPSRGESMPGGLEERLVKLLACPSQCLQQWRVPEVPRAPPLPLAA